MDFVVIQPGEFLMGSPEEEAGRYPGAENLHPVRITQPYEMMTTEVTQAMWMALMEHNPSAWKSPDRPVEFVSYWDCLEFASRVDALDSLYHYRLPTEAEWEYACRAGTNTATWAADVEILLLRFGLPLDSICWYGGNSGLNYELAEGWDTRDWYSAEFNFDKAGSHPVGTKPPNPWGLYDIIGNVHEWVLDTYDPYPDSLCVDPLVYDKLAEYHIHRGGSWYSSARRCRAAFRYLGEAEGSHDNVGLRLVRVKE